MRPIRVDAHNHVAEKPLPQGVCDGHATQTAAQLVDALDHCGFDHAVVFPEPYQWDYLAAHEELAEAIAPYAGRLLPLAIVNPRTGAPGLEEVERFVRDRGGVGIKFRPDSQACPANCAAGADVLALAARLDVPVFIHSGWTVNAHPFTIADAVADFPTVRVVMQHMFDLTGKHCISVAKRYDNVLLETSGVLSPYVIREAIETVGPDRVLFGSDTPYLPRELELLKVTCLRLPAAVQDRLLGANAAALLRL